MAGRPREFDLEAAVDTAVRLFWRHGYEGTSVAMLADAIGIKVPSLYKAFGSKHGLFERALERYGDRSAAVYLDAFEERTPRAIVSAIFEAEIALVAGPSTPRGCLMVQGALATSPTGDPVRRHLAATRRAAETALGERLERASREGPLPPAMTAAELATLVMTINAGLAVQAKSGASARELRGMVRALLALFPG